MSQKPNFVRDKIKRGYAGSPLRNLVKRERAALEQSKPPKAIEFAEVWKPNPGPQATFFESDCREVLYGGQAGGGKLLRVDEPIPTPSGWTTMGELQPGDLVIDCDGNPTEVVWCSEVEENPEAWELEFDDGTTIQCDAGHQWVTLTAFDRDAMVRRSEAWRSKRRASRPSQVAGHKSKAFSDAIAARNSRLAKAGEAPPERGYTRTTREIVETLTFRGGSNHSIPNPGPLALPEADLPVDPYVLGAWLGDGTSVSSGMTGLDREVWENAEKAGFEVRHRDRLHRTVLGLVTKLRPLGVVGDKHIPAQYLRASIEQRIALLQGLCDTDGHATEKGSIEFTTTSEKLAHGFRELLVSLGIKPSFRPGIATLNGREIGPKWRIQFWTDIPAFRVERQLARQKRSGFRGTHAQRYIVAARRVPATPMRCIGVAAESKTYLAGRSMVVTHNSSALTALVLKYSHLPGCNMVVFRRDSTQFKDLIDKSKDMFPRAYPGLEPIHSPHFVWTFPSGATANYRHLQLEKNAAAYDGWEINLLCFDELTHFTKKQYRALCARVRSARPGHPTYIRATTNPGGEGHDWVFAHWGAWLNPEFEAKGLPKRTDESGKPVPPARPGEVWWVRTHDDGTEEYFAEDPKFDRNPALSRTFIPAALADNPHLAENDPSYEAELNKLDPVRRAQLKHGDWLIKPSAGRYFKRAWVEFVDKVPATGIIARVRAWDLAGTEKREGDGSDPDYTAGVRLAFTADAVYIEDARRGQLSPGAARQFIKETALEDGTAIPIFAPQDPGQAGKWQVGDLVQFLRGFRLFSRPVTGDKVQRFGPFSGYADPTTGGVTRVYIVRGAWNREYLSELEDFPTPGIHDDYVDATSSGFNEIFEALRGKERRNVSQGLQVVGSSSRA